MNFEHKMYNSDEITDDESLKKTRFKPYSEEELTELLDEDPWEAIFSGLYVQILFLIRVAMNFNDYVQGKVSASECPSFSDKLHLNYDPHGNYLAVLIEKWRAVTLKVKKIPSSCHKLATSITRLFASLVNKLQDIRPSGVLRKAQLAFEHLFKYLFEDLRAPTNDLDYQCLIKELFDEFSKNFNQNAADMSDFEAEIRNGLLRNRESVATARAAKSSRFDEKTATDVMEIWQDEQKNQIVKGYCGKGRITHAAVFEHMKKKLARHKIYTLRDFVRCLESARNRHNYRLKFPKKTEK